MDITRITKITGDYNNTRPYLLADKAIGSINFCFGLTKDGTEYVSSSALLEDIRKITDNPSQVLVIFSKDVNSILYEK